MIHRPPTYPIKAAIIPDVKLSSLEGNVPVFEIRKKGCDIVTMDMVFVGGRVVEHKRLASSTTASLLKEGAGPFNSVAFIEAIDFYGGSFSTSGGMDTISLKLTCRKRHFSSVIEIICHAFDSPHFSEEELNTYIARKVDKLSIDLIKNDTVCYREITENLYGADHPYGYNSTKDCFLDLQIEDVKKFYNEHIHSGNCFIFLAGDVQDHFYQDLDKLCQVLPKGLRSEIDQNRLKRSPIGQRTTLLSGAKNQTSVRLGTYSVNHKHEDYLKLLYLNTILGGYFGSRLSLNLREDKGITYGIDSVLETNIHDGLLLISAEVSNDQVKTCLHEVYKEMDILCNKLIGSREIMRVNNYLMGYFITLFDGPFNSIRAVKTLALSHFPLNNLQTYYEELISLDKRDIRVMAQKYLKPDMFKEVIVGDVADLT